VAKKVSNRSPLNCRVKNRLNGLFGRNPHLKQYFLLAWTPFPSKSENKICTLVNGTCIGLPIDQVSGSALKMPGFEDFSGSPGTPILFILDLS